MVFLCIIYAHAIGLANVVFIQNLYTLRFHYISKNFVYL